MGWISLHRGAAEAAKTKRAVNTEAQLAPETETSGRLPAMTSNDLRKELLQLTTAEKLELVEELWDSIPEEDQALESTPEQREDLDAVLPRLTQIPTAARPGKKLENASGNASGEALSSAPR